MYYQELSEEIKPIAVITTRNSNIFRRYVKSAMADIVDEYLRQESFGLLKNNHYIYIDSGFDVVTSTFEHIDRDVELVIDYDIIAVEIINLREVIVFPKVSVNSVAIAPVLEKIKNMVTTWLNNIVMYANDVALRIKPDIISDDGVIDYIIQHDIEFHSDGRIYA